MPNQLPLWLVSKRQLKRNKIILCLDAQRQFMDTTQQKPQLDARLAAAAMAASEADIATALIHPHTRRKAPAIRLLAAAQAAVGDPGRQ